MAETRQAALAISLARVGRAVVELLEEFGYYLALVVESCFWVLLGPSRRQPVRLSAAVQQMVEIGINGYVW